MSHDSSITGLHEGGEAAPAPASGVLPRRLGITALVLIIVAFNAPIAVMAGFGQLSIGFGNGIGAPLSFLVAGAILLTFAVGFVGMSKFIANPGAFYLFIVAGIGKPAGLAGGFLATAAYILLCAGSYPYVGLVAVDFMTRLIGVPLFNWQSWSIIFLVIITTLGLLRIDVAMRVLGKLVTLECILVAIWQASVLWKGGPEGYALGSFTPAAFLHGSPGLGIMFAMLCMIGIEAAACFRAETKNPERAVGLATYIAIAFMALFYAVGIWLYIVTQGPSQVVHHASTDPVGTFFASVQNYLGVVFVHIVSLVLVTSQMVATNAVQGSASRYLFALGRDRVLPAQLARVHVRLQSPYVAVLTVGFISLAMLAVIILLGISPVIAYAALTGMGIYFLLPLLIATSCSVIAFYSRNPHIRASAWTRWIAPAISTAAFGILFILSSLNLKVLVGNQAMVWVSFCAVVAVPLGGWLLARSYQKHRPAVFAAIGND